MKRLQFDSQGKLSGWDGNELERKEESRYKPEINLKKSDSLEFLKEKGITHIISALSHFSPPHPNDFEYLDFFVAWFYY